MESWVLKVVLTTISLIGCTWGNSSSLRVYRGHETEDNEIPYIVSIMFSHMHTCGGSIMSEEWIITAAHCVANRTDLKVFAGLTDLTYPGDNLQVSDVKEVFIHPLYNYRKKSIVNDIALVRLDPVLELNDHVAAIDIIGEYELRDILKNNESGIISGWGSNENSLLSNTLFSGTVKLLSEDECSKRAEFPGCGEYQPKNHLCSQLDGPTQGAGFMDDGGPLVVRNKLVGVILHGKNVRDKSCPHLSSIYGNIRHYRDFVESHVPNIMAPKEDGSGNSILLEAEIIFEERNTTRSNTDNSIGECYVIRSVTYWIGDRDEGDEQEHFNFLKWEQNDFKKYMITLKLVKSQNPKGAFSMKIFNNFFISPYVTIRHT